MWRILVPVDGSEASQRAVRHVASLAGNLRECEALLLNVQQAVPGLDRMFDGRPSEVRREQELLLREPAEKTLAQARAPLGQAGIRAEVRLEFGEPSQAIVECARRLDCNAIVMGAGRLDSAAGRLRGSIASRVVHLAHVPVTLVR